MSHPETKTIALALGQILVVGGDLPGNLRRARESARMAAAAGARILLLPETLDCGWCDQSALTHAGPIPGSPAYESLAETASRFGLVICAGLTERAGGTIHNAAVLIDAGGRHLATHRKVNELDLGEALYTPGTGKGEVVSTALGTLGLMICADAFLEGEPITRSLAARGAELILSPCAWAVPPDHDQERDPYGALWRDVYGRVARETGTWIAGASNVGTMRHGAWAGYHCIGSSLVVNGEGAVCASGRYGPAASQLLLMEITVGGQAPPE